MGVMNSPGSRQRCKETADMCHLHSTSAAEAAAIYLESLIQYPGDGRSFAVIIEMSSSNRKFCNTKNGLMGIGPLAMREGNMVCVLFSGKEPYILRPIAGSEYQFVGECYIQHEGYMKGEAINRWEAGELTAEWFPL